jgi:DNA-binding GntR family transcriptional regulator
MDKLEKKSAQPELSLVDRTYMTLRQRILDNEYPPGFQQLEQELAADLGVSRTPVREALIRLQHEGLVRVIPRHGMRVLPVSIDNMREIYEVLTALECLAAELAAKRQLSERQLQPLIKAAERMDEVLSQDNLEGWAKADEEFHRQLVELSGNKLLIEAVPSFADRAHRTRMFTLRLRPKPTKSTAEHLSIIARIRAGDAAGAMAVSRAHRERGSRELLDILDRFKLNHIYDKI